MIITDLSAKAADKAMTVGELRNFLAFVVATSASADVDEAVPEVRIAMSGRIKSISVSTVLPGRGHDGG